MCKLWWPNPGEDGSVVTWGSPDYGANSTQVQDQLTSVRQIQATNGAFAAIREDGTVILSESKLFEPLLLYFAARVSQWYSSYADL